MDRFYIACIIIGALVMIICYLLYDRSGNRREIRQLRVANKFLLEVKKSESGKHTTVSIPDKSLMGAINDALQPMGTVDFNEMYKPF